MKKEILTPENFKQTTDTYKTKFIMAILCLAFTIAIFTFIAIEVIKANVEGNIIPIILFFSTLDIIFVIGIFKCITSIKEEDNNNKNIATGNLKIIEDQIYDIFFTKHTNSRTDTTTFKYYVKSKILGTNLLEKSHYDLNKFYDDCQKNDLIYCVFYSNNSKLANKIYPAKTHTLSPELSKYLIPYDKNLGQKNFTNRINEEIKKLEKSKKKVKCKKCDKKYNIKEYKKCPNCKTTYNFNIMDVINETNWYK